MDISAFERDCCWFLTSIVVIDVSTLRTVLETGLNKCFYLRCTLMLASLRNLIYQLFQQQARLIKSLKPV